jgi:hypothetical protein
MRRIDQIRAEKGSGPNPSKRAQMLETLGLILIVILILAFTITRSWHYINWSAR